MTRLDDFDFFLPPQLIAQRPCIPRDRSRLLVVNRKRSQLDHLRFFELPVLLRPGDTLVLNDTRVLPARFFTRKKKTGGLVEMLYVQRENELWEVLLKPSRKVRAGQCLCARENEEIQWEVIERRDDCWLVRPLFPLEKEEEVFTIAGKTPTPPYLRKTDIPMEDYQTVYARHNGSVAAPTAGLHFTEELLGKVQENGNETATVTLHVGPGTFLPVKTGCVEDHRMHAEKYNLSVEQAEKITRAREKGGRVIAVGTTVVRVLESIWQQYGKLVPCEGETDLFITPGFRFQAIDAMVTNFHLPRSTLFILVCAFGGTRFMQHAYREAVERKYRFYSFGDAMFIT